MKIEIDQSGMDKVLKEVNANLKKAEIEANSAAQAKSTPAEQAKTFVDVMRKHGVEVDIKEVRKKFGG